MPWQPFFFVVLIPTLNLIHHGRMPPSFLTTPDDNVDIKTIKYNASACQRCSENSENASSAAEETEET